METKDKMQVIAPVQKPGNKNASEKSKADEKKAEQPLSLSQILEKQLSEIKRKKQLADRRDIFLQKNEELGICLTQLEQEQAAGNFTTDNFTLTFSRKNNYRDEDAFKISNPNLMIKFLVSLKLEINQAVQVIEDELLKGL